MPNPRLVALLIGLVTLLVYLPVTQNDFVDYDDNDYVTNNRVVQNGITLAGIEWAFTTGYGANWFPVTWLSHMADCTFFKLNAGAHHFTNVMIHSMNSALLFLLLMRLTRKQWPSILVAVLFAWHPVHVESVAWVAERKDVLSTFFALLTLLNYSKYVREKSRPHYLLALLCFAFGLMSKPMLVTLPFVLLLLDLWPLQRFSWGAFQWRLVLEKTPFFILSLASCVITLVVQRPAMTTIEGFPFRFRLENSLFAVGQYLLKIAWPSDLSIFYPLTKISAGALVTTTLVLTGISTAIWLTRRRSNCWLVGWCWFLGTLVPVIGLVYVGNAAMADRYTYIPSIGIFMAVVFGIHEQVVKMPRLVPFLSSGVTVLLIAYMIMTERQLSYWRDTETLFRHALAVTKNNDIAHDNLGSALELQGRNDEALAEYCQAVTINPNHYQYHYFIGNVLVKLGRPAAAVDEYNQCIIQNPTNAVFYSTLGNALAAQKEFAGALKAFFKAERLDPGYSIPHIGVAKVLFQEGQNTNAVEEFWAAVRLEPYNYKTLSDVARFLASNENAAVRDGQSAVALALKANELSGGLQSEVQDVLGMALAEAGDFTNAIICAQNALEIARDEKRIDADTISQRLDLYQKHQPWRESFGVTNGPAKD